MNKSNLRKIIIEEIENTLKEQVEIPPEAQNSPSRTRVNTREVDQHCAAIQKACVAITAAMKSGGADEAANSGEPSLIVLDGVGIVKDLAMLLARLAVNRGSTRDTAAYERALRTLGRKLGNVG